MPVDLYVGGAEHAVLHLLYARFWHKVLHELGHVSTPEPFQRLVNQGMILGEGGVKMSKSLGNVINPDDIIREYGADSMRMYEMFMGPLQVSKPWSTQGLAGVHRFLNRVWNIAERKITDAEPPEAIQKILHKTIKKVTQDTDALEFNTAIAQMMIFINEAYKLDGCYRKLWEPFILLLGPYAPHMAEEMARKTGLTDRDGRNGSIAYAPWPAWNEALTKEEEIELVVQVNGKVRSKLTVPAGLSKEELEKEALAIPRIQEWIGGKTIIKKIIVPNKLVNLVVKG